MSRPLGLEFAGALVYSFLDEWPWSSYALTMQDAPPPMWLQIDWLLGYCGADRTEAIGAYKRFVAAGVGAGSPIKNIRHQLLLGDDAFVTTYRSARSVDLLNEVPREHRRALALSLAECQAKFADRDEAIAQAYLSTAYTMTQIAAHFHISYRTDSRIVHKMEHLQSRSCAIGGTDPE